jgi:hypothetical protein
MAIEWPDLRFPPVNLWSAPRRKSVEKHRPGPGGASLGSRAAVTATPVWKGQARSPGAAENRH